MSTHTMDTRGRLERWAPLAGILYVVLGVVMLDRPLASAAAFTLMIAAALVIGGVFRIVVAALERFHGWVWVLLNGVVSLGRMGGEGVLGGVVLLGGGLYAALSSTAIVLWGATEQLKVDATHPVHPELLAFAGDVSWFLNSVGFIGAAALMIAASVIALRAAIVPRWLGWLSALAGIVVVVSFAAVPQILWGVWVLVVSVGLFRGERAVVPASVATAAT